MKIKKMLISVDNEDVKNGEFIVPAGVEGFSEGLFSRREDLIKIMIPNSATEISDCMFYDCRNLTSITMHNGIKRVGELAFRDCYGLMRVTIPDSVTTIGNKAFAGCKGLLNVTMGNGVTSIGDLAFYECSSLTSIVFPDSVTSIGNYAFASCSSLTNVVIGNSVTSIGNSAFCGCKNLTKNSNKYYKALNPDLTCRGFQYKENKWFKAEGEIQLCVNGFHACSNPFDLFNYYCGELNKDLVIYEVELEGISEERHEDSKVVAKRIRLVKKFNSYAELLN